MGGHIIFGADPADVGLSAVLSCVSDISCTSGQIGHKFAWIRPKNICCGYSKEPSQ